MTIRIVAVAVICLLAGSIRGDGDWPQFRGPDGQGISPARNVPLEWSSEKNLAWKQEMTGTGWSSPAVVGGRVFLTSAIVAKDAAKEDQALAAVCYSADTGKPLWETEVFRQTASSPGIHSKNSHASPSPLVVGDNLFVHFGHQGIACLSVDGKIRWRNAELKYPPVHGNGGSPILVGDRLIFSCDGGSDPFLAAVDGRSGELLWKTPRPGETIKKFAFSTPLAIEVEGRTQVVSPGAGSVGAFDPATGGEIWRVNYEGYSVIPRPVFGHGLVFMSTGYDSPEVLAIRPTGEGDVTETHVAWRLAKGAPNTPSLLLVGDELYMASDKGVATCADAKTGRVHWQERVGGAFSASPVFAGGRIYLLDEEGRSIVLAAGKKFEKLAENNVKERTLASIAVVDGAIFLRGDKHLYRIGAASR